MAAGTEYTVTKGEAWALAGRAGYNGREAADGAIIAAGLSSGLGIAYRWVSVDYAFLPFTTLGSEQRLSLTVRF